MNIAYGKEYFISIFILIILITTSIFLLKNKKEIYKDLLLYFLSYFMLLINLVFVIAKYDFKNINSHILLVTLTLIISAIMSVLLVLLKYFKVNKKVIILIKYVSVIGIILSQIILMIVQAVNGVNIYFFAHLCNQMSWLLPICILLIPNSKIINYVYYASLIGAAMSLVYPATLKLPDNVFHLDFFRNIFGHGALLWATLFMWATGRFSPNIKYLWYLPVGASISYSYAFVVNSISKELLHKNANYLYLNSFPVPYLNSYITAIITVAMTYLVVFLYEKLFVNKKPIL